MAASDKIITLTNLSRFKTDYDAHVASLIASAVSTVYKFKGTKTVAEINALTGQQTGDTYNVSDSGTLTSGSIAVVAGDNVTWTGSAWDKLAGDIDLSGYLPLSAGSSKELTNTLYVGGAPSISSVGDVTIVPASGYHTKIKDVQIYNSNSVRSNIQSAPYLVGSAPQEITYSLPAIDASTTSLTLACREDLDPSNIAYYLGYVPYDGSTNPNGYITGVSSTMIVNALGYTPYDANNPSGFITGITSLMVTNALGYTPLSEGDFATQQDIDNLFV